MQHPLYVIYSVVCVCVCAYGYTYTAGAFYVKCILYCLDYVVVQQQSSTPVDEDDAIRRVVERSGELDASIQTAIEMSEEKVRDHYFTR